MEQIDKIIERLDFIAAALASCAAALCRAYPDPLQKEVEQLEIPFFEKEDAPKKKRPHHRWKTQERATAFGLRAQGLAYEDIADMMKELFDINVSQEAVKRMLFEMKREK